MWTLEKHVAEDRIDMDDPENIQGMIPLPWTDLTEYARNSEIDTKGIIDTAEATPDVAHANKRTRDQQKKSSNQKIKRKSISLGINRCPKLLYFCGFCVS